ncbi:serine hydrolase FSH [Aspergillus undulatus]|uniref:serine hydrolase FSH n=1 Tax=Aspergillus undulatus TaxID=1810928 RepID=UPI003CCCD84F
MRFLCLHGIGSNSRILQQQTAAIRYELGNRHTYEFVEGTIPWEADPELKATMLGDEQTFSYCDPASAESCLAVIDLLERYVAVEGPYDGVLGFSLGANIAMSWMIQRQGENQALPFKVGIFFSNSFPLYDMAALQQGRVEHANAVANSFLNTDSVSVRESLRLDLPTAHIWGARDAGWEHAQSASRVCKEARRLVYVHGKGHEISTASEDLISMVKAINRAIGLVDESGVGR